MADEYLPEDIILKIIANLPAKPLLRFKCISKHWNKVISHPNFVKSRSCSMILLPGELFQAIDNTVPGDSKAHLVLNLRSPSGILLGKQVKTVGTVNGIVLLVIDFHYDMILYNPLTREFKKVSYGPSHRSYNYNYVFGFGYGTTPDDLKIVMIGRESSGHGSRLCDVFSLKTRSWSSWNTPSLMNHDYFDNECKGIFVNGLLYWRVYRRTRVILALDLKVMEFSEIELPPANLTMFPLGTLNGNLCAIYTNAISSEYELWVMSHHGLRKSWSKVSTLTSLSRDNDLRMSLTKSMCIMDAGKIVMLKNENEVIIYDMLKDSYKKGNSLTSLGTQAIEYMESCVSPSN